MKRLFCLLPVLGILLTAGCGADRNTGKVTFADREGKILLEANSMAQIYEDERWAFLECAFYQAAEGIAQQSGEPATQVQSKLFSERCRIQTSFDADVFSALKALSEEELSVAGVITDLDGSILAVYSAKNEEKTNQALAQHSPYSAFKPLSVYAQAVERGVAGWSSLYEDSPCKQVEDETGTMRDWPANASGRYSERQVTVYDALRKSLNTVAVRCLEDVGVAESIAFLQKNLDIPLKEEAYVLETYTADEVVGNIALGYLETGVTPVQMAGWYQIFATGGQYTPPSAVDAVLRQDGSAWYERQTQPRQVISQATADVMNKLLQGVLKSGSTGEAAAVPDVEIAGKTGTGESHSDNWFVGVTPGYSCAVWHGKHDSNRAAELFCRVVTGLYGGDSTAPRQFVTHSKTQQIAYCAHSGEAISPNCSLIEVGYFTDPNALPQCSVCGNK